MTDGEAADAAGGTPAVRREGPDMDGFHGFRFAPPRFNSSFGPIRSRVEPDGRVRVRIETGDRAANIHDNLHGGFALAALDQALPVSLATLRDKPFGGMVTLALATQFVSAGAIDRPVDILVTVVRETGRLFFLSGTVEQAGGAILLSWQATMRKVADGR